MKKDLKISIITPLKGYDTQKLKRYVNSVTSQSYQNFELIIKHNGNSEESLQINRLFDDPRVTVHTSPDDSIPHACNQAMNLCDGDLITIFSHDDAYRPDAFQTLINNIDSAKWYFGNINYHRHSIPCGAHYVPNPTIQDMEVKNMIPQPASFWRREVYDTIGKYDESFKLCWDYDYWIRIWRKWAPKYINFTFADYFLDHSSISLKFPNIMDRDKIEIKKKHFHV